MGEVGFLVNTSFIPGASVPWYFLCNWQTDVGIAIYALIIPRLSLVQFSATR